MKGLLAGVFLLLLIGIAGFFYRNTYEHPVPPAGEPVACTMEAKVCPDGSAVGREGPNCEFRACAAPNAEDKTTGIAFAIPAGFVANADAIGADETLRAVFDKSGTTTPPDSLVIRDYPIPTGKTANDVMIANTMYESSGDPVKAMSEFKTRKAGNSTFYYLTVERFEAIVHTVYYLPRANDVLRFEVVERNVMSWMEPTLVVESLPSHQALLSLLATLQLTKN